MSIVGSGQADTAERVECEGYDAAVDYVYDQGWTDGLPFLLPTAQRVEKLLAGTTRNPLDALGVVPPRRGVATVESIAINATMAGCLPEHMPVVLAAIEALLDPSFNLNGVQATTHLNVPLVIVGGPVVKELNFNSKLGVFGGGNRANAAVGRAVRLVLHNLGGGSPLQLDRATFGHPGKYCYAIAEDLDDNPWAPLHTTLAGGAGPDESAVTVFACEAPHNIVDTHNFTPEGLLRVIAMSMTKMGSTSMLKGGQGLVVLSPERANRLRELTWSRQDVQRFLFEHARVTVGMLKRAHNPRSTPKWVDWDDPDAMAVVYESPDDIHVMVAGGPGPHSVWCPGWGINGGFAVTRRIEHLN
jgi:hypothetical protein